MYCRRLILSELLCLFLFLVFSLYLLYVDGPRSNTQFRPNVTQLGPISLQPSRGSPSPSAEHSRLRPSWCPHARPKVFPFLPALIGPATCCLPCTFCMVSSPSANAASQPTPLHHANGPCRLPGILTTACRTASPIRIRPG